MRKFESDHFQLDPTPSTDLTGLLIILSRMGMHAWALRLRIDEILAHVGQTGLLYYNVCGKLYNIVHACGFGRLGK